MSGEQFTLTISQSTSDSGDFAIHFTEQGSNHKEEQLLQIQFATMSWLDETVMDDIVAGVARKIATHIVTSKPYNNPMYDHDPSSAREIVQDMIKKMQSM